MEEKKNKKSKIIKGVALLGLFLLVFGVSYALFSITLNGTKKNKITTGNLSLELLNEEGNALTDNTIGLENAVPMTISEGKALAPYTFTLKNNGSIDAEFSLSLKDLPLEEGENRLDDKYVAIFIEKGPYSYATEKYGPYLLSEVKDKILDAGVLGKGRSTDYKIYLWLDESADENAMNKTFLTSLEVKGYQETNDTLSRSIIYRSSSNNTNNGILTYYADGHIDVSGKNVEATIEKDKAQMNSHVRRREAEMYIYYAEKAGYNLDDYDLTTARKFNQFVSNTLSKDTKVDAIMDEIDQEIIKKYNLQDKMTGYEYPEDYAEAIKEENPTLAKKIYYEDYYKFASDQIYDFPASFNFDNAIEELYIEGGGVNVTEVTLPTNLKNLKRMSGFSGLTQLILPSTLESIGKGFDSSAIALSLNELTIPASVKYVEARAFIFSNIKTLNIMGSTDGWNENWNVGYDGTVNRLG